MNYIFYDTETTGTNTQFDQILQFAAILTDEDLQEIERFEIRCRLERHVVPSPKALQVTGQAIEDITDTKRISHYEMMLSIQKKLQKWGPSIFIGWNTIGFDEPLLQQAFFKSLLPPYFTVTNGNERADVMKLAQCLDAFVPSILTIPKRENGRPIFKLDQLAPANGFPHLNAHDALADVEATIFLARKMKSQASEAWETLCRAASKQRVLADLRNNPVCVYRDSFFGTFHEYALCRFATNNNGAELCFDLQVDPKSLTGLNQDELKLAVSARPKPIRTIRPNKAPLISPVLDGDHIVNHSYRTLLARAEYLLSDRTLQQRLQDVTKRDSFEPGTQVEQRIFEAYASKHDEILMSEFHSAAWSKRAKIVHEFQDDRYRALGMRILYNLAPYELPQPAREKYKKLEAMRLLGVGVSDPDWLTLGAALDEVTELITDCKPAEMEMLATFKKYLEQRIDEVQSSLS
jgi:exodeoxyribonuclease-1